MFKGSLIDFSDGKCIGIVTTSVVVTKSSMLVVLAFLLVVLSLNLAPSVSAQYGGGGNAPCGYSVTYYSYSYPYFFTRMNRSFVRFVYYSYPSYSPNPTYQLTVATSPSGLSVSGSGQFCKNQAAQFSVTSPIVYAGTGTRYVFTGWSGDYSGTSTSGQVTMSGSKSVVANFKTQYLLTVNSAYGTASGSDWYDAGTTAYASLDKSIVDVAAGVRAEFTGWTGDVNGQSIPITVQMNAPKTLSAQWKNQYYVSLSSTQGNAQGSGWYDEGSTVTISSDSSIPAGFGSQYVFDKWVGITQVPTSSAQLAVDRPISLVATYRLDQTQLYETVGAGVAVIAVIAAATLWLVFVRRRRAKTQPETQ